VPDASTVLLHVLVVLVCAKVAAEVSERIRVPAVAGEIVAGLLIGPSVLGLVGGDQVLRVLGELGVLLLLLDVGLQMDLRELAAVGKASVSVAVVGVVTPFAAGFAVAGALGLHGHTPLFLGAALTATSVGVTARVFAELRALATIEARTVLGAAVADDVLGLVVLAVVVRIVSAGRVDALGVAGIAGLAVAFLVVATVVGVRLVPAVVHAVRGRAKAPGTVLALTLAVTLSFAELARLAGLAPIVGAFVAGICLAGTRDSGELRRDLLPLGHVFVPVFFLQIGIDANVRAFAHPRVLGLAAALLAVAILGKLAAAAGLLGSRADRLLVGVGMIPRGEVGLIFAAVGLRTGVLDQDTYGALLLVVLLSTLVAPPLLRWRLTRLRDDRVPAAASSGPPPPGGWLTTANGTVDLAATPASARLLVVGLDAARLVATHRPGDALLDWLAAHREERVQWTAQAAESFVRLLTDGDARSWRFLEATGLLERALPELAHSVRRRRADPSALDGALRWATVDRLRALLDGGAPLAVAHPAWLLAAGLTLDCADGADAPPVAVARRLVQRLDLGAKAENEVALLVGDSGALRAAAARTDALTERVVVPLAEQLGDAERAAALYLLSLALGPLDDVERARLRELYALVAATLANGAGTAARNAVEAKRAAARRLVDDADPAATAVTSRIADAPRDYLLGADPAHVAADARLLAATPRGDVGVAAGQGRVAVVVDDKRGAFATVAAALAASALDVSDAVAAVWPDGAALLVFAVRGVPDAVRLRTLLTATTVAAQRVVADAEVTYDDAASPWYTLVRVAAPDAPGLLAAVATAFADAGIDVHRARVTTHEERADDVFEVTDATGRKLSRQQRDAFETALRTGRTARRSRRSHQLGTRRKHSGHRRETAAS
jgi:Kef-type K+ transport system membrane component KefB